MLYLGLSLLLVTTVSAQYEEKDFTRYTVKNGVSDNYITSLQQDEWGYMWAGTDVGLNRFDGNSFTNFYLGGPNLQLASNGISQLKSFGSHQMGIISAGGFQLLDTKTFSLRNYFIPDSTAFNNYHNKASDAALLPDGSYALTTASGFYVFDPAGNLKFRHDAYRLEDIGKKIIRYGREIFSAGGNKYLVYAEESGLHLFDEAKNSYRKIEADEKEWKEFLPPATADGGHWITKKQLSSNEFIFLYYQHDSIVFFNQALKKSITSPLPFHTRLEFNWSSKITMLSDSTFAINCGSQGFYLFKLNRQSGRINCYSNKLLASYKINCLFLDKDKRLWAGTSKGILQQKLNGRFATAFQFEQQANDKSTEGLSDIIRYRNKFYLFRYSLFSGLTIIDTASMKIEKKINFYSQENLYNQIISVQVYHPDTLWLGTNGGILWFDTKTANYGKVKVNGHENNFSDAILAPAGKDGYAWMCSHLGGVVMRYDIATRSFRIFDANSKPALPFNEVKSIAYDAYGDVWFGGHSLSRWNNTKQLFDTLISVYGGANKFNDDILALGADEKGSLWLHNGYNGLLEYKIREKKFNNYTMKDGLPSDVLGCFGPVVNDILWIGSNSNLTAFNIQTKTLTAYGQADGLTENKPSSRRIYFDTATHFFYMLCQDNVIRFPAQPAKNFSSNNQLRVEDIFVNNKKHFYNPTENIYLSYNENDLTLHFSIIDFEAGNNYRFAYKLNNAETWSDLGEQRSVSLTGLPSGNYLIHFLATNKSGEQKSGEISFTIEPPFWKRAWFITCCIVLLSLSLYYLYRRRIRQVRQKANIDKLLAQTEMKALHAQMNPHFIFNSLNSIREMILNDENKEASHFLSKFAHLIRITLDQSGQTFISLRNTIDYLNRYIEMEQIRNSHFKCSIEAAEELDLDETILPPMLIQPFIENAIWHGTAGNKKNIEIKLCFKKQQDQLICTIGDDGIGIDRSLHNKKQDDNFHQSVGIANIKNRIRLLNEKYELKCSIDIIDKSSLNGGKATGTLVTIKLPLEITADEQN